MRFLQKAYDGPKNSGVIGLFIIEIKSLFSIVFLKFDKGSRENFHSHAFNAYSFFLKGSVIEEKININTLEIQKKLYKPSLIPKYTPKDNVHRVNALETTYCLTFRGPWSQTWFEVNPNTKEIITLTNGRNIVNTRKISENT